MNRMNTNSENMHSQRRRVGRSEEGVGVGGERERGDWREKKRKKL